VTFGGAVLKLIGHIVGGVILFFTIALAAWLIGLGLDTLHRLHPFPESVLSIVHTAELMLLYADMTLAGFVILYGVSTFIKDLRKAS
jgi:hypothetical protein